MYAYPYSRILGVPTGQARSIFDPAQTRPAYVGWKEDWPETDRQRQLVESVLGWGGDRVCLVGFGLSLELGLSTQPVYPTNPPESEPKTAQTSTPTIGGGSSPTKPDAFRSVGSFPLPKPKQPNPIINPETSDDIRRFFDENIQNPMIFEAI